MTTKRDRLRSFLMLKYHVTVIPTLKDTIPSLTLSMFSILEGLLTYVLFLYVGVFPSTRQRPSTRFLYQTNGSPNLGFRSPKVHPLILSFLGLCPDDRGPRRSKRQVQHSRVSILPTYAHEGAGQLFTLVGHGTGTDTHVPRLTSVYSFTPKVRTPCSSESDSPLMDVFTLLSCSAVSTHYVTYQNEGSRS